jgi:DNA modification methylase
MKYLIRLVTPNNGKVLDPFCGSGSTGMAAVELGHEFVGCDLDPKYCAIAEARIAAWCDTGTTYPEWFTE